MRPTIPLAPTTPVILGKMHCAHIAGSGRSLCVDRDSAPCESRSRGKFVRSREPAIADDIGDGIAAIFSGSQAMARPRPAFRSAQRPTRTAPSRYGRRGQRRPNHRRMIAWGRTGVPAACFRDDPVRSPERHATVRVTKPYSAPNFRLADRANAIRAFIGAGSRARPFRCWPRRRRVRSAASPARCWRPSPRTGLRPTARRHLDSPERPERFRPARRRDL